MNTSKPTKKLHPLALSVSMALASGAAVAVETPGAKHSALPEVTVTADFREAKLQELPVSATVITQQAIQQRGAQHLEQLLALAPNVNFSSGSSRARYFQIRGIGERSEFKEPVNPSVGIIIDEVDFTGAGSAGTLFDVSQVEILRGPQGTRYGANALAGLVNIQTHEPTEEFESHIEASAAEYDSWSLGAVVSGPLSEQWLFRLATQQSRSDGYIDNVHLGRDDTNNLDEQTTRAKLRWLASDALTLDFSAAYFDLDNGYDAFSLDNNRNTLSDQPGHDRQQSTALSVKADWTMSDAARLETIATYNSSDLEYGYDEDWSFNGLCSGTACDGWEYSSTDNYLRDRDNQSLELRLLSQPEGRLFNGSTDWVVGVYWRAQSAELTREYTYQAADFHSDYDTDNMAVFGELVSALSDRLTLTLGLRVEDWQADYADSEALVIDTDETLYGGKLVVDYMLDDNTLVYASLSRGYKAGGVNTDGSLLASDRAFDTEYQWAYEAGVKASLWEDSLQARLALFYTDRQDQQIKGSILVVRPDSSTEFIDYIDNAAEGTNYGVELETLWQASERVQAFASVGLLNTEVDKCDNVSCENLVGRDQAHAPSYQYAAGVRVALAPRWQLQLDAEGKDEFYFSDSHDAQSDSYRLVNASLAYQADNWQVSLWGKNLTDEDYQVRGFQFGNDPRDFYTSKTYTQLGEPRIVGVSGRWSF